jgi:mannosyltransferase
VPVIAAIDRVRGLRLDVADLPFWGGATAILALTAISLWIRTRVLGAGFWIDEGLSVGIAHHPLTSIPHLLRQDGSPPLYYLLLHVWIDWFGDGERATHALSLVFALACIPLAYWVGRSIFGRLTGWICAGLAAVDPFLSYYAQETRMYSLVAALSFVVVGAYVHGVVYGRRRWLPVLGVSLALLLYTHNWGLFLALALGLVTLTSVRDRWREAAVAAAITFVLYAPWLPTLAYQSKHTGAPWAMVPGFYALALWPSAVLAGDGPLVAVALAAGAGLAAVVRGRNDRARRPAVLLALIAGSTVLAAWVASEFSPAWAARYLAVVTAPVLVLAGAGFARAGRLGIAGLLVVALFWANPGLRDNKENAREIAHVVASYVHPGDLILSTHPEQVPVLRYYFGPGYRWATTLGPVRDTQVMDWADALQRLRAVTPAADLEPVLASIRPGQHLVVVSPVFRDYRAWQARWTRLVYLTSTVWTRTIAADPRFRELAYVRTDEILLKRNYFKPLQAVVYVRRR